MRTKRKKKLESAKKMSSIYSLCFFLIDANRGYDLSIQILMLLYSLNGHLKCLLTLTSTNCFVSETSKDRGRKIRRALIKPIVPLFPHSF
jgi:hypothetical protein